MVPAPCGCPSSKKTQQQGAGLTGFFSVSSQVLTGFTHIDVVRSGRHVRGGEGKDRHSHGLLPLGCSRSTKPRGVEGLDDSVQREPLSAGLLAVSVQAAQGLPAASLEERLSWPWSHCWAMPSMRYRKVVILGYCSVGEWCSAQPVGGCPVCGYHVARGAG